MLIERSALGPQPQSATAAAQDGDAATDLTIASQQADISARIERLPITRRVFWTRNIIGAATFFDGYTVIAIAYAMPVLVKEWSLPPRRSA